MSLKTTQAKPKRKPYLCKGGPFDGEQILMSSEGDSATAIFSSKGRLGRYVKDRGEYVKWEPAEDLNATRRRFAGA